jgi:hypothetical protein
MQTFQMALMQQDQDLQRQGFELTKQTHADAALDRKRDFGRQVITDAGPNGFIDEAGSQAVIEGGFGHRLSPQQDATISSTQFAPSAFPEGGGFDQMPSPGHDAGRSVIPTAREQIALNEQARIDRARQALDDPRFMKTPTERRDVIWRTAGNTGPAPQSPAEEFERARLAEDYKVGHAKELAGIQTAGALAVAKERSDPGLTLNQEMIRVNQLRNSYVKETAADKEVERQFSLMTEGLKSAKAGLMNPGSQAVLVTFQKILDPTSVVRESEYARSPEGLALLHRLEGLYSKYTEGGPGVPFPQLAEFGKLAEQFAIRSRASAQLTKTNIEAMADHYGLPKQLITGAYNPGGAAPAVATPNATTHAPGSDPAGLFGVK